MRAFVFAALVAVAFAPKPGSLVSDSVPNGLGAGTEDPVPDTLATPEDREAYARKLRRDGPQRSATALSNEADSIRKWFNRWLISFYDPARPSKCAVGKTELCFALLMDELRFLEIIAPVTAVASFDGSTCKSSSVCPSLSKALLDAVLVTDGDRFAAAAKSAKDPTEIAKAKESLAKAKKAADAFLVKNFGSVTKRLSVLRHQLERLASGQVCSAARNSRLTAMKRRRDPLVLPNVAPLMSARMDLVRAIWRGSVEYGEHDYNLDAIRGYLCSPTDNSPSPQLPLKRGGVMSKPLWSDVFRFLGTDLLDGVASARFRLENIDSSLIDATFSYSEYLQQTGNVQEFLRSITRSVSAVGTFYDPRVMQVNGFPLKECAIYRALDQGQCGTCWSFAIAAAMSARLCVMSGGAVNTIVTPSDVIAYGRPVVAANPVSPDQGAGTGEIVGAIFSMGTAGVSTMECGTYACAPLSGVAEETHGSIAFRHIFKWIRIIAQRAKLAENMERAEIARLSKTKNRLPVQKLTQVLEVSDRYAVIKNKQTCGNPTTYKVNLNRGVFLHKPEGPDGRLDQSIIEAILKHELSVNGPIVMSIHLGLLTSTPVRSISTPLTDLVRGAAGRDGSAALGGFRNVAYRVWLPNVDSYNPRRCPSVGGKKQWGPHCHDLGADSEEMHSWHAVAMVGYIVKSDAQPYGMPADWPNGMYVLFANSWSYNERTADTGYELVHISYLPLGKQGMASAPEEAGISGLVLMYPEIPETAPSSSAEGADDVDPFAARETTAPAPRRRAVRFAAPASPDARIEAADESPVVGQAPLDGTAPPATPAGGSAAASTSGPTASRTQGAAPRAIGLPPLDEEASDDMGEREGAVTPSPDADDEAGAAVAAGAEAGERVMVEEVGSVEVTLIPELSMEDVVALIPSGPEGESDGSAPPAAPATPLPETATSQAGSEGQGVLAPETIRKAE